jgi:hypothetical protein
VFSVPLWQNDLKKFTPKGKKNKILLNRFIPTGWNDPNIILSYFYREIKKEE